MKKRFFSLIISIVSILTCLLASCNAVDVDSALDKNNKANKMIEWLADNDGEHLKEIFNSYNNYEMKASLIDYNVSTSETGDYIFNDFTYRFNNLKIYSSQGFDLIDLSEYEVSSIDGDTTLGYAVKEVESNKLRVYQKSGVKWEFEDKNYSNEEEKESLYKNINTYKSPMYLKPIVDNLFTGISDMKSTVDAWYKQRQDSQGNEFRISKDARDNIIINENISPKLKFILKNSDNTGTLIEPNKLYYNGIKFSIKETSENSGIYKLDNLTFNLFMFDEAGNHYGLLINFNFNIDMNSVITEIEK